MCHEDRKTCITYRLCVCTFLGKPSWSEWFRSYVSIWSRSRPGNCSFVLFRLLISNPHPNADILMWTSFLTFQDYAKAFKFFNLAADQGWVDGQLQLGIMYYSESRCTFVDILKVWTPGSADWAALCAFALVFWSVTVPKRHGMLLEVVGRKLWHFCSIMWWPCGCWQVGLGSGVTTRWRSSIST